MNRENIFQQAFDAMEGKYGEEDLLTDQLGFYFRLDKDAASAWFEFITGVQADQLEISTQPQLIEYPGDRPDMLLKAPDMILICEHKMGSSLGEDQLERYLELTKNEEKRTQKPHRLALVNPKRVSVPEEVLNDPQYCKPQESPNFRWQDLYRILQELRDQSDDKSNPVAQLRTQFIKHLRFLRLSAIEAHAGYPNLLDKEYSKARDNQQRAFFEQWYLTQNWFEKKNYKTNPGSRVQLYIINTDNSEIPENKGVELMIAEPTRGDDLPRYADFEGPCIEFNIGFSENQEKMIKKMAEPKTLFLHKFPIKVSVQVLKRDSVRKRVSFAMPLKPLLDYASIPEALLSVISEIYSERVLPAYRETIER